MKLLIRLIIICLALVFLTYFVYINKYAIHEHYLHSEINHADTELYDVNQYHVQPNQEERNILEEKRIKDTKGRKSLPKYLLKLADRQN